MEVAIRLLLYTATGLALLVANLWFVHTVYKNFLSSEYVIAPFNVIDPSGKTVGERAGLAFAQMMAARLSNIQSQLRAAQASPQQQPSTTQNVSNPLAVTTLFVPRPVEIPTGLFEPVNITATVGGVEVGGIFAWLQRMLSHERALVFTTYERADKAIISADLSNLSPGARLWFESGKHPDDIATNAAYALIQVRLAEKQSGPIKDLELGDFRRLFETIFQVDELNRRAAQGYDVEASFVGLLPLMETQVEKISDWPELMYLTASIAEGAHNVGKAVYYYRKLQSLGTDKLAQDARVRQWTTGRLAALGMEHRRFDSESQERFVKASHEFARRMALDGPDPTLVFVKPTAAGIHATGIQALWNSKKRQYEVNPLNVDTAGLPQYVALSGRFLDRNYAKCWERDDNVRPDTQWWNEFRYSAIDYLIQTQKDFSGVTTIAKQFRFFAALKTIEATAGVEQTTRLALELLNRYDCDWTRDTIADRMLKINDDRGLMPRSVIVAAMSSNGFKVESATGGTAKPDPRTPVTSRSPRRRRRNSANPSAG
jgi:hypothetical protein